MAHFFSSFELKISNFRLVRVKLNLHPVISMSAKYVDVVFPLSLNQAFTYAIPPEMQGGVGIGCRVVAPFGPRKMTGLVTALSKQTHLERVKPIQDVLDVEPLVSKEILSLAQWLADYYLASVGEAIKAAIPAGLLQVSKQVVEIANDWAELEAINIARSAPRQAEILRLLLQNGRSSIQNLRKRLGVSSLTSSLSLLQQRGMIRVRHVFPNARVKPRVEKYVELVPETRTSEARVRDLAKTAPAQAACLAFLLERRTQVAQRDLMQQTGASLQTLKALSRKNWIRISEEVISRDYYGAIDIEPPPDLVLTSEQQRALQRITAPLDARRFETFLLFGVTGSGKTQVYIEAIKRTLAHGQDAIVLVPEISLTPQTVQRFRAHFEDQVAVLHSAMSDGERLDSWRRLQEGKARVAIGARSAVFAPVRNLGLVVVDEEHETTYKQSDAAPRYHARDVAVVRAKFANAVVVLGSATPAAESFYNACNNKYALLELKRRVSDVALPTVHILDMQKERRMSGSRREPVFSRLLARKIEEKVVLQEQIILLLNRRGFSSFIKCRECDFIEECKHCNITLTYHLQGRRLRCHYCGSNKRAPEMCPNCLSPDIIFRGLGTQQVEEELELRFPQARSVRMDLDTTGKKWSHNRILKDFGDGKYDILLGTQMVAKGLDFRKVTLVGVINADIGMMFPDFRAAERTFQLLTQVAGRAGRKDLAGEVIIQTYMPDSFCLSCAQRHDFHKFYNAEILERRELNYPPFSRIVCVHFKGEEEPRVRLAADSFARKLETLQGRFLVLGPSPSPISKIQDLYRYQIFIKADRNLDPGGKESRQVVEQTAEWFRKEFKSAGVRMTVDVDPASML
ncbi:MAG: primosomal protein N' [bacterium]